MSKVKPKLWATQKPQVGDDLCRFFRSPYGCSGIGTRDLIPEVLMT